MVRRDKIEHLAGTGLSIKVKAALENANSGNPVAQHLVGYMYMSGTGVRKSMRTAVKWFTRSAEQGIPESQYVLGLIYASGSRPDMEASKDWLVKAAEQGYENAQIHLGDFYFGVKSDLDASAEWYARAAERGSAEAKFKLGRLLLFPGDDSRQDNDRGLALLKEASDSGDGEASFTLYGMYLTGHILEANKFLAYRMLRRSAEQNHPAGLHLMGVMYMTGDDYVGKNEKAAVEYFGRALDEGNELVLPELGSAYLYGIGTAPDTELAFECLTKGAADGSITALNNLAIMYLNGVGTAKDEVRAAKLFAKAADEGSADAISNLGTLYATGRGVPRDTEKAKTLFRKAADMGNDDAKSNLEALESGASDFGYRVWDGKTSRVAHVKDVHGRD